jgi:predicted site-specific integrase-resolvase
VISTEEMNEQPRQERIVVVYARVSANENRPNLDSQAERLCYYCTAKGWKVVKEVGSGVNDGRRKLLALLADPTVTVIVVEHKDRLTVSVSHISRHCLLCKDALLRWSKSPRTRLQISSMIL